MKPAWVLGAVLAVLGLAGCQTLVRPQGAADQAAWQARRTRLAQLHRWHLEGRIGVVARHEGGSASFDWRQDGPHMRLFFAGPFGVGAVSLTGSAERFVIRNSEGQRWVTDTPSQALAQALGWPVPIASLRYWVTGRPAPDAPYRLQVDARGLVTCLRQQGWTVQYSAYTRVDGLLLPVRLVARRGGGHVKLIVRQWHLRAPR